jgi:hypothetical protein
LLHRRLPLARARAAQLVLECPVLITHLNDT